LALAITSVVGLLISQWFNLHESHWVLATIVIILLPARFEISLTFDKVVHRIIGTSIGAAISNVIISNIDSQWATTLLALLITGILASLMKTKNYAFQVIFITVTVLLVDTFANPSTGSIDSFARL
jgi:uncharacterized membrane protein YccC